MNLKRLLSGYPTANHDLRIDKVQNAIKLRHWGTLLTTIHGDFARASCTPDELKELDRKGIAYRVDRKGRFKLDGLADFYQTTFHTRAYVAKVWSDFFEVVEHIDGGLGRHQDLVILRRRNAA